MWICCNEKLFKKLQIFGGAKRMTQRHRTINNSKFKTTGDKIMNINSNNRRSTIRTVARTWIYTPVIATSFLISAQPTFATIDNRAIATGTYNAAAVNSPQSNLVQIPVTTAGPSLSVAKSVLTPATVNLGTNTTIADAGDRIVFQYIVTNNGNVSMTAVVPVDPGPRFGPSQVLGTGTFGGFVITAGTANLLPGQTVTYTNTYTMSTLDVDRAAGITVPANAVNNSATATGTPASGTLGVVPPGVATTTIPAGPVLSVAKAFALADVVAPGNTANRADVGEIITYTYTVQNTGNVAISNVLINDTHEAVLIAAGLIIGETLITEGPLGPGITSTDATANNGTWSLLQPGATIRFTYTHTVTQAEFDAG
jgi:uncharacterized repeat protein (TIGR01451 family)